MFSIKSKIIFYCEILFGVILCSFALILYKNIKHNEIIRLDSQLEQYASGFNRVVSNSLADKDFPDTSDILELKSEGPEGIRYRLTDKNGNLIIGTINTDPKPKGNCGFFNAVINAKPYRCLSVELEPQPQKEYCLLAAVPLKNIYAALQKLVLIFAVLIPLFLLISGLISWLILSIAFRPLRNIITAARNITENNLQCRLTLPRAQDEIRMLGKVFNEMIARLEVAFNSQKQFVADASHEIRTPLAIIRSELEFAQRHNLEAAVEESVTISLSEIDSLTSLTEGLLTLSRFDAGQVTMRFKKFKFNDFLTDIICLFESKAAQRGITLNFYGSEDVLLLGDLDLLKRAVVNVLDNAIKYSPVNSLVNVLSEVDHDKNRVVLIIDDNGPGISKKEQADIFKRFYRCESSRTGTEGFGLGLPISEQIIKLHKGEISVYSELGKGSRFKFLIPVPI